MVAGRLPGWSGVLFNNNGKGRFLTPWREAVTSILSVKGLYRLVRRPGLWVILVTILLITVTHYEAALEPPVFMSHLMSYLGINRFAFERILYLAPVVWAGFLFGHRGAVVVSFIVLALMLPQAVIISPNRLGALFESIAVFIMGNVLAITFASLRNEKERRSQLELAQQSLQSSEAKYRGQFENALDSIVLHDVDGNIIDANRSAEKLLGYKTEELKTMNVRGFMSQESLDLAHEVGQKLLKNESVEQPYEQHIIRKDKSEAIIQVVTSLVFDKDQPMAFQNIGRDITEQKRMQENLRLYSQMISKAQEEERKRISHELHEEVIQDLVVQARELEGFMMTTRNLPEAERLRLDKLRQHTANIIQGLSQLGRSLRPPVLDHLGLMPALEWLANDTAERSGIAINVDVRGKPRRLPEEVETLLFRVVQEGLRNVWYHSEATQAEISVEFDENEARITVSDKGKGSNLPKPLSDLARDGKLGLAGIQERVLSFGGRVSIQSTLGQGTKLTIGLPSKKAEEVEGQQPSWRA